VNEKLKKYEFMLTTTDNDPNIVDPGILGNDEDNNFVSFKFDDYPDEVFFEKSFLSEDLQPHFTSQRKVRKLSDNLLSPDILDVKPICLCKKQSRSWSLDDVRTCAEYSDCHSNSIFMDQGSCMNENSLKDCDVSPEQV